MSSSKKKGSSNSTSKKYAKDMKQGTYTIVECDEEHSMALEEEEEYASLAVIAPAAETSAAEAVARQRVNEEENRSMESARSYEDGSLNGSLNEGADGGDDDPGRSLFDRLGGEAALEAVVDQLFEQLASDWRISKAFGKTSLDPLKPKFRSFLASGLGGPEPYTGPDMRTLGLTAECFDAVEEALTITLAELAVNTRVSKQVLQVVRSHRPEEAPATGKAPRLSAKAVRSLDGHKGRKGGSAGSKQSDEDATIRVHANKSNANMSDGHGSHGSKSEKSFASCHESHAGYHKIDEKVFEELKLPKEVIESVKKSWNLLVQAAGSREAVGEALFTAFYDASPTLQSLFRSPKAVTAVKFAAGLTSIINTLDDPAGLKSYAEDLSFRHLMFDITHARIAIFRNAIIDLLEVELGDSWEELADAGWQSIFNYMGGAMIFIKDHYAVQLTTLNDSWAFINRKTKDGGGTAAHEAEKDKMAPTDSTGLDMGKKKEAPSKKWQDLQLAVSEHKVAAATGPAGFMGKLRRCCQKCPLRRRSSSASSSSSSPAPKAKPAKAKVKTSSTKVFSKMLQEKQDSKNGDTAAGTSGNASKRGDDRAAVPTGFNEMLHFNATVMGASRTTWLNDVLDSFDAMVKNVANAGRLQEECEIVALRLSKHPQGSVDLAVFKSCMLASLRSLLPRQWDSGHEVAWSWMWQNVEKILVKNMEAPVRYHKVLETYMEKLNADAEESVEVSKSVYKRLFEVEPGSQDYFKQSHARLHFIAQKVLEVALQIYRTPGTTVNDVCALGLRHVGYNVPIDYFGPFVSSCCDVIRARCKDDLLVESYLFALSLVAKVMVRTITEGRTVVMLSINANSIKQLRKAISCAPRRLRTTWLLNVEVGTQRISPLSWAMESGYLDVAEVMLCDLLTIRADRERYYFGLDELFERHPDIVKRMVTEAAQLMPAFFDGLIWRSKFTKDEKRRVNYYVRHLLINSETGGFSDCLQWIVYSADPVIINHPAMVIISDTLWRDIVRHQFLYGQLWFIFGLFSLMLSQAILPNVPGRDEDTSSGQAIRGLILFFRGINYCWTLLILIVIHIKHVVREVLAGETVKIFRWIPVPVYITETLNMIKMTLTLLFGLMLLFEPALWCPGLDEFLSEDCDPVRCQWYSVFTMWSLIIYWLLMNNLSIFSTALSAFVLVATNVVSEIGRFLAALTLFIVAFSAGVAALRHTDPHFNNLPSAILSFTAVTVGMLEPDYNWISLHEPALLYAVILFMSICAILLLNLLIAQLSCSYEYIFHDMLGFARLHRAALIVKSLGACSHSRWEAFVDSLGMEHCLELNEGDVGPAPGIQVEEDANDCIDSKTLDNIRRFGGDTSPELPWPEEVVLATDCDARFDRIEKIMKKLNRKLSSDKKQSRRLGASSGPSNLEESCLQSSDHSASDGNDSMAGGDD